MEQILGNISSIETGFVDGPGVRCVVYFQGCGIRCIYCHNPETWNMQGHTIEITPQELVEKVEKYRNYFGEDGGVTFSGGEPLLQPEFLVQCLKLLKKKKFHTCIDTAGFGFGDYKEILKYTDLVLLDIKAIAPEEYQHITGQNIEKFKEFLLATQECNTKLWLRQVIVPGINDTKQHIEKLKQFASNLKNVEKIELLPYRTIGVQKYETLNIPYRLDNVENLSEEKLEELNSYLK